jgi:hypothetical protein
MKESELRKLIREEIKKRIINEAVEVEERESHEISAIANALNKAIAIFNEENLPEIPNELATALKTAKSILTNMTDNPGQYKAGQAVKITEPKEVVTKEVK